MVFFGLRWHVQGTPGARRTTIRLMKQGQHKELLTPEVRRGAVHNALQHMLPNIPVDTGKLKQSAVVINDMLVLGPKPYNRQKLLAERAGRKYRQRKKGPVVKAKWYALPANTRSRMPGYIENALEAASKDLINQLQGQEAQARAAQEQANLDAFLGGAPLRRGAVPTKVFNARQTRRLGRRIA